MANNQKTPIELLEFELKLLERSKEKSIQSFEKGDIDIDLHVTHLSNLEPMIIKFKKSIGILKASE